MLMNEDPGISERVRPSEQRRAISTEKTIDAGCEFTAPLTDSNVYRKETILAAARLDS
jgi:hypothetical protein